MLLLQKTSPKDKQLDVMVKVAGISFRCDCGCNVFRHPLDKMGKLIMDKYVCNSCSATWSGE